MELIKILKLTIQIHGLNADNQFDQAFKNRSRQIYQRQANAAFYQDTKLTVRPFIAAREDFLKFSVMLNNDGEYIFSENFFFTYNLKYSIWDNFEDLTYPPVDIGPAEVRTDIKKYLNDFDGRLVIGRAQFDYHFSPKPNNHIVITAGLSRKCSLDMVLSIYILIMAKIMLMASKFLM